MNNLVTIVIVAIVGGYFLIAKVWPFFNKVSKAFARIHLNKKSALNGEEYKKLSLGAIYSEQQSAFINSLETGLGKDHIRTILAEWWGIADAQEAGETLQYLRDKGFRFYFPVVFKAFTAPTEDEKELLITSNFSSEEDLRKAISQLHHLKETYDELKQDGIITGVNDIPALGVNGWDCGRLVFVTRLCYDAGYITANEAWSFINSAYELARASFRNWDQYAKSYVLGRAMWGGASSANTGIASIARYLLVEKNSPWVQLPFAA